MHHRSRQLEKSLQVLPNLATPALRRELHATRCESLSSRYCPKDNWSDVYSDNLCAGKVASSPDKSIIGTSSKDFGSTILACESAAYARRSPHHTNWIPPPASSPPSACPASLLECWAGKTRGFLLARCLCQVILAEVFVDSS